VIGGEEIKIGDYVVMKRAAGFAKISDVSYLSLFVVILYFIIICYFFDFYKIYYKGHPDSRLSEGYCSLEVFFFVSF